MNRQAITLPLLFAFSIIVCSARAESAITITSFSNADPNPGVASQPVTFSFAASEGDVPLTYTWQFGDGTSGTGAMTTHIYTAPGIYLVSVTAADAQGNSVGDSLTEIISNPGPGTFTATKASGKLSSAQNKTDSFTFSGVLSNLPAGGSPANQTVTLNLGGAIYTFPVNKTGSGKTTGGTIKFIIPRNFTGGDIKYQIALTKANLFPAFEAGGFDPNSTVTLQVPSIPVLISYGSTTSAILPRQAPQTIPGFIFAIIKLLPEKRQNEILKGFAILGISP